jgi:hypothetical protein
MLASGPQISGSVCKTLSGIATVVPLGMTMYVSEVPEIGSERGTVMVSAAWNSQPRVRIHLRIY